MFINFWYPADFSESVTDKPIKVKILGQHFVVFRDSKGQAHCLSNVCVHRCASLANGWVKEDHLVCPYHGWEYSGEGKCQAIPSLGYDTKIKLSRAQVDSYPTVERYGLVFVFLGDLPEDQRPPLMDIEQWGDPAWRCNASERTMKANYRRLVENALDFSHPEFVHLVGRKGADPDYKMPDYDVDYKDWGAGSHIMFKSQAKGFWKYFRKNTETQASAGTYFHGPNQFVTRIHIDSRMKAYQYIFQAPIDEYSTRTFLVSCRNFFTSKLFDKISHKRNMIIAEEDRVITEAIEPVIGRDDAVSDLSVKVDEIQIIYRNHLKQWQEKGWRIDTEALANAYPGKDIYMVPSPARRVSKSWVFKALPMLSGSGQQAEVINLYSGAD